MKFADVWAKTARENVMLKIVCFGLLLANIAIAGGFVKAALKEPLIIDRGGKIVTQSNHAPTDVEIKAFLRHALPMRFDSGQPIDENIFADAVVAQHRADSEELKTREMSHQILVHSFQINHDNVVVDSDRLVSLSTLKAVIPFPLEVKIMTVRRSLLNPFGLKVISIQKIDEKDSQEKEVKHGE